MDAKKNITGCLVMTTLCSFLLLPGPVSPWSSWNGWLGVKHQVTTTTWTRGPFLMKEVTARPWDQKQEWGMRKCWEYAEIFVVSTIAECVYFVACTTAYIPNPCFWFQVPWWPHLMNIHWEWSFHGRHCSLPTINLKVISGCAHFANSLLKTSTHFLWVFCI